MKIMVNQMEKRPKVIRLSRTDTILICIFSRFQSFVRLINVYSGLEKNSIVNCHRLFNFLETETSIATHYGYNAI